MSRNFLHLVSFLLILSFFISFSVGCYNKIFLCNLEGLLMSNNTIQNSITDDNNLLNDSSPSLRLTEDITVAFIADSHLNSAIFPTLKESLEKHYPSFLIHAGDLTDFGTLKDLSMAKSDLDNLNLDYFALPGDHDIAETSSEVNFDKVFSTPTYFTYKNINFLFIRNEFNFTPLKDNYLNDLLGLIPSADVIILSQPIYVPEENIFSLKFMGSKDAFDNLSPQQLSSLIIIKNQRDSILTSIRNSRNNKIIISGDHHRSSSYPDPVNKSVSYHVIGSLSKYIYFGGNKISQNSLQSNRYSLLRVFKKGLERNLEFEIKEIEL